MSLTKRKEANSRMGTIKPNNLYVAWQSFAGEYETGGSIASRLARSSAGIIRRFSDGRFISCPPD
jgi:hypothetical protein